MRSTKLPSWIDRLLGTHPTLPPPDVFALDAQELRYGSFHHGAQGYVFETSHRQPLPPEAIGGGVLGGALAEPRVFWEFLQAFVEGLPPIREASLVLPDTWLRLTFTETSELPRKTRARDEVLRWKLKRLVPFRVEDLRISAIEVRPFPEQEEPHRLLLGFAGETQVSQLEEAFSGVGIEIGQITNTTLALLAGLKHTVAEDDLAALVTVQHDAFTLSYWYRGEPLIYRYKEFAEEADRDQALTVRRNLRLTTTYLRQHFPDLPLRRCFLAAPPESEARWLEWLYDEIEVAPEPLAYEHFPLARTQIDLTWLETAPLLGAASLEVR
ncbi:MAG: hypothetical protein GY856_12685 [bacterium]|nr:hypothetical protein [bacterium]